MGNKCANIKCDAIISLCVLLAEHATAQEIPLFHNIFFNTNICIL